MRSLRVIGIGITATMISAAAWLGCSSDDSTSPADAGPDATGSSSSGGSSSSSGSGSSSGGSSSSSSSSGAGDSGRDATLDAAVEAAIGTDAAEAAVADASDAGAEASLVTWQQVYGDVISQHCIGCHEPPVGDAGARGGFAVGHLDMGTVDAGYLNLVNQPPQGTGTPIATDAAVCNTLSVDAGSDSGLLRVTPGNPGLSLLYSKVNGYVVPPPCGAPMPPTVATFTEIPDGGQAAAAAEIRQWISQGANP
jgi:mono/diheme cytochrome c family protein